MAGIRHLIDTEAHKALFDALREEFTAGLEVAMQSTIIPGMIMPFSGDFGGSDGKRPINPHSGKANEGFALCDGGAYQGSKASPLITTPDLRERFIMGAGAQYKAGTQGGSLEHTHTVTVAPHTLTVAQMPSHKHGRTFFGRPGAAGTYASGWGLATTVGPPDQAHPYYLNDLLDAQGGSQPHAHGASSDAASSLPPYYALAYIMKL